jgi:hypothetical protein
LKQRETKWKNHKIEFEDQLYQKDQQIMKLKKIHEKDLELQTQKNLLRKISKLLKLKFKIIKNYFQKSKTKTKR